MTGTDVFFLDFVVILLVAIFWLELVHRASVAVVAVLTHATPATPRDEVEVVVFGWLGAV
jgi:hypothetical protein